MQAEQQLPEDKLVAKMRRRRLSVFKVEEKDAERSPKTNDKHVMVSYSWMSQPAVKKVVSHLKEKGFQTWFDVEQMSGMHADLLLSSL